VNEQKQVAPKQWGASRGAFLLNLSKDNAEIIENLLKASKTPKKPRQKQKPVSIHYVSAVVVAIVVADKAGDDGA
jgi:hypothetical protein